MNFITEISLSGYAPDSECNDAIVADRIVAAAVKINEKHIYPVA